MRLGRAGLNKTGVSGELAGVNALARVTAVGVRATRDAPQTERKRKRSERSRKGEREKSKEEKSNRVTQGSKEKPTDASTVNSKTR